MKFDFRRLSPAVLTSLGLIFLALLFASFDWIFLAWVVGLVGIALNITAVAVTEIDDGPGDGTRRVSSRPGDADRAARERKDLRDSAAPVSDIEADAVRDADGEPVEPERAMASALRDGKPGKGDKSAYSRTGSTAVPGPAASSSSGSTAVPGPVASSSSGSTAVPGPVAPSSSGSSRATSDIRK